MIDFATLERAATPNHYLVCDATICPAAPANRSAAPYALPAAALKEAWFRIVSNEPRVTLFESDENALQYEFVQRTPVFRFPDRITVRFVPLEDGRATLAIYSRSVYGYTDFGMNRARIERWLALLDEAVGSAAAMGAAAPAQVAPDGQGAQGASGAP